MACKSFKVVWSQERIPESIFIKWARVCLSYFEKEQNILQKEYLFLVSFSERRVEWQIF